MRASFFQTLSQGVAATALFGAIGLTIALLQFSMRSRDYVDPIGVDLSGKWRIQTTDRLEHEIEVPRPIPGEILSKLGPQFIYKKRLQVPQSLLLTGEPISLSLGSIKGDHEVYWNGTYIGAGTGSSLALYRVPNSVLEDNVTIEVRVKKMNTAFPGIVHAKPVLLGRSSILEKQVIDYYFQTGVKPLIPAALKFMAALLFLGLCAFVPRRSEYLSFALFCLFASIVSGLSSRFTPGYADFYLKQGMMFLFYSFSLAAVPAMTASFLRWGANMQSCARIYGYSIALIAILSALIARDENHRLGIYRSMHFWGAISAFGPSCLLAFLHGLKLRRMIHLRHRVNQILTYAGCMFFALIFWTVHSRNFLRFEQILAPELIDLGVYSALGFALLSDFRFAAFRSQRVGNAIPSWFKSMLGTSQETNVSIEIPILALAVDAVSYTKTLSIQDGQGKEKVHEGIRKALAPLTDKYGAEKLSDRGDGGLYGWELSEAGPKRDEVIQKVLFACRALSKGTNEGLSFRVGLAAGKIRGEWRYGDYSFMGEALNAAARLETMAQPGTALVHESLVSDFQPYLSSSWMEAEIKGLRYRGKIISEAS